MIGDFTIVSRILTLIPIIGRPLSIAYMCIINAYYCFEYTFVSKEWPLSYRVQYMQDRAMYMLGFGE
jgi:etoposide-induced 2.4 mRNA